MFTAEVDSAMEGSSGLVALPTLVFVLSCAPFARRCSRRTWPHTAIGAFSGPAVRGWGMARRIGETARRCGLCVWGCAVRDVWPTAPLPPRTVDGFDVEEAEATMVPTAPSVLAVWCDAAKSASGRLLGATSRAASRGSVAADGTCCGRCSSCVIATGSTSDASS